MTYLVWGPGLSIVLRSLPGLVLTPILACSLATIIARRLPAVAPITTFLESPTPTRAVLSCFAFVFIRRVAKAHLLCRDMKKFGLDVVEAPKLRTRWPWNLDLIPRILDSRKNDYCLDIWLPVLERYGNTFNLGVFGGHQIFTTEPENIKTILCTDFGNFRKGPDFRDKMFSVLGTGVFNSDGEMWRFHRTISRPYFTKDRISHFDLFARHSDSAIAKLLSRLSESTRPAIDFQDLVARFTLDSSTEFLFGQDVHSLAAPLPYPHSPSVDDSASFAAAFGRAQELVMVRCGLDKLWPFAEMWWDRTAKDMAVIDTYVKPILQEKLEDKKRLGTSTKKDKATGGLEDGADTLLDHLVRFTDDEVLIKDEIVNILVAGRDTTAATLTFAVYLLATNPQCMAKLRAEILARVGSSNYPTTKDFREMKYLRAVINETLRLFPAVPLNRRNTIQSTVLKSGKNTFYVPKNTDVTYSVFLMHRRKDLWGPDADTFDPERWLDHRLKQYLTPNPFIFLPFNAGPRICLGQQFAYNESSFFLVRLLQQVKSIELAPEAHPAGTLPPREWQAGAGRQSIEKIWPKHHLTIYSNGGMWVRMKQAGGATE